MADTFVAIPAPRVIGANVIAEVDLLHTLTGVADTPQDFASVRDDLLDTLFAIECLPNTRDNLTIRARAVATLYGGDFTDWEDDSPSGRLVRQIVEALAADTH